MGIDSKSLPHALKLKLGIAAPDKPERKPRGQGRVGKAKQRVMATYSQSCGPGFYDVIIPLRVVTETNHDRHWRQRQKRADLQREAVRVFVRPHLLPPLPVVVTFTRYGLQLLDCDNLVSAFKHVRDEVAALYEVDDAPGGPITWATPAQEVVGYYAVRIRIQNRQNKSGETP
jgi:hypothetical protein